MTGTWAASTLFYTKRSRVSRIWAITDTGDEKRTGEVPTLILHHHVMAKFQYVDCSPQLIRNHPNYAFRRSFKSEHLGQSCDQQF